MQAKVKSYTVFLGLGSNWHDKLRQLSDAVAFINSQIGIVKSISSVYESKAVGFESQNTFFNMCIVIETQLAPNELICSVLDYESSCGRIRNSNGYTDRPIDLDILFIDDLKIDTPDLKVPHPEIYNREFVIIPLLELLDFGFEPIGFSETLKKHEKQLAYSLVKIAVDANKFKLMSLKKN
jgi:2-amino-4-hydroxy-6-hydroxymethyldihydropteridine diphosphokinase